MFDTWKRCETLLDERAAVEAACIAQREETVWYLQLRLLDLSSGSGHLVFQEGQFCVCGAAADAASTLLQVSQGTFQPIHGTRSQVHLYKRVELATATKVNKFGRQKQQGVH